MKTNTAIEQVKRKAYLAYHQDGILDILLGTTIIGIALWILLDSIVFTFMSWMSFILYASLKNTITIPRFGYVRFDETNTKYTRAIGVGVLTMLLTVVVGTLFFLGPDRIPSSVIEFLRKYFEYTLAGIGALVMAMIGTLSGIRRLTGYAVVTIVVLWFSIQMQLNSVIPLLITGSLILIIGIILMTNFIRRYPLHRTEGEDAI